MRVYRWVEAALFFLRPIARRIRGRALERPVALFERGVKGFLFDCKMCGQCALSQTGMSCPMNCPKSLRNGPCGGVRPNGACEVEPDMPCVWVEAWHGAQALNDEDAMIVVQRPLNHSSVGSSSWLRVAVEGESGTLWHDERHDERHDEAHDEAPGP